MYCPECGHHNRESARFCARCGASLIELTEGEATISFTPPAEPGADSEMMDAVVEGATLVIRLGGGRAGDQFPVGPSRTSIGRAPQSDVFLDDITVSREHAVLEQREDGVHIVDQGSLNGTYVNRERVEDARLSDGDELQIGKYRLAFIEH
ncbi:MAG TPA: FHA domain-containing protein [Gaiellales bacterium]|nr:FHA domain-containing protein [Gaiellales bacterium]